jgi:aspartate/methionine/tyrosine aminotransferase
MKISARAQAVEPFYAMEFGKKAAELESAGHRVVKLNLGEPAYGAPRPVVEAMREVMDGRPMPYTSAVGLPQLRAAIASFYRDQHDVVVDPACVVVTAGASAGLLLALAATVDPGDAVLMADPSYPCNRRLVETFGARVSTVPTTAETRFQLSGDLVREHWTPDTRALMIASPSNPTGTSVPHDDLVAMCAWARDRDAWRIVDEIYLNLSARGQDGAAPASVLSIDPDAIVINSFSKYFGMTGWRLGWCIVPEALAPVMERLAQNYFICPSTPAQYAALACFTPESLAICEARTRDLAHSRAVTLAGLRSIGLPVPVAPDGAFYAYFDVSSTGLSSWQFCERALTEAHVALTPGRDFGVHSAESHVRLSFAASTDDLEEGIRRLGTFVASLS